jgi:hypothetical protein
MAFLTSPAAAELNCWPAEVLRAWLAEGHGERLGAFAALDSGALLERLDNPDDLDWSLIVVLADGRACMLATGTGWRELADEGEEAAR